MTKVLILQNMSFDGPGYLGDWLHRRGCSVDVRNAEAGDAFPSRVDGFDALALLGGAMSANDDLPALRTAESLFLQALRRGVPTLGHCLGGQLMSRALGASVHASPQAEVGWHHLAIDACAENWFGGRRTAMVMHWHYDAFALPAGATALASSAACPVQSWTLGPHLAMQFHVEVDSAKVLAWCAEGDSRADELRLSTPTIHTPERMLEDTKGYLSQQQALADDVYSSWLARLCNG